MSCAMLLCAMLFRANDQQYFAINAKLRNKDENMALSALENQIKTIVFRNQVKELGLHLMSDTFIVNDLIEEPRKKQKQDNG